MIKNISNLGDAALYCDFGKKINKEINSKVINYFKNIKNSQIPGITNIVPSYNKIIITFDLNITHFKKIIKEIQNLEIKSFENEKNKIIEIPIC